MSTWIAGLVAMAAQDFIASLIAKVAVTRGEHLVRRGDTVTIPVAILRDLLAAQTKNAEQSQALLNQFQAAVDELSRDRAIYVIEAPALALRVPLSLVDASTSSFAPNRKVVQGTAIPKPAESVPADKGGTSRTQTRAGMESSAPPASHFRERMMRAYPNRELEFR